MYKKPLLKPLFLARYLFNNKVSTAETQYIIYLFIHFFTWSINNLIKFEIEIDQSCGKLKGRMFSALKNSFIMHL